MPTMLGYSSKRWIQPQSKPVPKHSPLCCSSSRPAWLLLDMLLGLPNDLLLQSPFSTHTQLDTERLTCVSASQHHWSFSSFSRKKPEASSGLAPLLRNGLCLACWKDQKGMENSKQQNQLWESLLICMKSICDSSIFRWMFKDKFQD